LPWEMKKKKKGWGKCVNKGCNRFTRKGEYRKIRKKVARFRRGENTISPAFDLWPGDEIGQITLKTAAVNEDAPKKGKFLQKR